MKYIELLAQVKKRNNCQGDNCLSNLPEVAATPDKLQLALGVLFGVFAAVAVLVIILSAINFATSEGDPEKIAKAKKTIIYAIVGLIICLSAEAIVWTLLGRI